MIKTSQEIPEVVDLTNPEALKQWVVAVKQSIDEIARKAKSQQIEIRSNVPDTTMIEEGEDVRYVNGVTVRTYTKVDGIIKYHTEI